MKKLSMIAMMALILGSVGVVTLAASGSGEDGDEMDLDKVTELRVKAAEKDADLVEDIVEASAEGDLDKVADLQEKRAEVAADFAEKIAEEQLDILEDLDEDEDELEDLLEDLEDDDDDNEGEDD